MFGCECCGQDMEEYASYCKECEPKATAHNRIHANLLAFIQTHPSAVVRERAKFQYQDSYPYDKEITDWVHGHSEHIKDPELKTFVLKEFSP